MLMCYSSIRLNTNKKWIIFYAVIVAAAFFTVWLLTKYERGLLTSQHGAHPDDLGAKAAGTGSGNP